ncbi:SDR family NAD(P)-dependent oxidoreductase [Sphingomonas sp.]|uniref:SDR family NAD(P)-dependent oxidoreductase n=1 Tax=Sphingomonas sp. TaxID=28214 RepID=UPI003F706618
MTPADIRLDGLCALVTGGANGIGKGIALGMAGFGADIVIVDIDAEAGARLAGDIAAAGGRSLFVHADVMDRGALRAAIDSAAGQFGRLDVLVNNAGGGRPVKFMTQSERSRDRHVEFNLGSLMTATHHAAQHMIAFGNGGAIINVSSIEGLRAAPGYAVYAACKAGMLNFTRTAAVELAEFGIRVNAIAPDIIVTEGFVNQAPGAMEPRQVAARGRYIPMQRDGVPDDCAGPAIFLASGMATYVTGTTISIDGGTWASSGWVRTPENDWRLFPDFPSSCLDPKEPQP